MATIIRAGRVETETWPLLDADTPDAWCAGRLEGGEARNGVLIPVALWQQHSDRIQATGGVFGVVLEATDDPGVLAPDLDRIPLVAVRFARFNDGRGLSIARLLRGRYGFRGELRAIGDVLRDQLFYMKRVGFDAFELRADQDPETALTAFADFSECYQAAFEPALPLFRRRCA